MGFNRYKGAGIKDKKTGLNRFLSNTINRSNGQFGGNRGMSKFPGKIKKALAGSRKTRIKRS
jgi:hypothetical protein